MTPRLRGERVPRGAVATGLALLGTVLLGLGSAAALADEGAHPAPSLAPAAPAAASSNTSPTIASAPGRTAASRPSRPLDLSAPPISHIMTREQVQALTTEHEEPVPEDVMVESPQYQAPVPRGQIRALSWALLHPLEAWRIFAPVTDQ